MLTEIVKTTLLNCSLNNSDLIQYKDRVKKIHNTLPQYPLTGWIDSPLENHEGLLTSIEHVASEIRACADVLVVVGVGGSFLGARAIQEALMPYFGLAKSGIEVVYVGLNMSGAYIKELLV